MAREYMTRKYALSQEEPINFSAMSVVRYEKKVNNNPHRYNMMCHFLLS